MEKKVTWPEAFRDVLVCAIERGQLPTLFCCAFVLVSLLKIPEDRFAVLVEEVGKRLANGEFISWPLLVISILAWFFHAQHMKEKFSREYERIGKEKSSLQEQISGVKLKSSED